MNGRLLGSRRFTLEDQLTFAELSGDSNPLHIDPVVARRTLYGDVVVHGIHAVFWALECLAKGTGERRDLVRLKSEFKRHIYLDRDVSCNLSNFSGEEFDMSVEADGRLAVRIQGCFAVRARQRGTFPKRGSAGVCRELRFEEVNDASGSLELYLDEELFRQVFPSLWRLLPTGQIAELLATTRLVGMECPGLHSIYTSHNLRFDERCANGGTIQYQVSRSDSRFSMVWLNVKALRMTGTITAFFRPRPQTQAQISAVCAEVAPGEFARCRALVIGGSRGLGEISAKIVAAGGGDVLITYHSCKADAERVTSEIRSAGLICSYLRFDSTGSDEVLLSKMGKWTPNQLYYFATPAITLEKADRFSREKFYRYCRVYVDGFCTVIDAVVGLGSQDLSVFYPSTIFLEQFQEQAAEYAAAKAAGELVCRHLQARFPRLNLHMPRLARMRTDQTVGFFPTDIQEPLFVMLEATRAMVEHCDDGGDTCRGPTGSSAVR